MYISHVHGRYPGKLSKLPEMVWSQPTPHVPSSATDEDAGWVRRPGMGGDQEEAL